MMTTRETIDALLDEAEGLGIRFSQDADGYVGISTPLLPLDEHSDRRAAITAALREHRDDAAYTAALRARAPVVGPIPVGPIDLSKLPPRRWPA